MVTFYFPPWHFIRTKDCFVVMSGEFGVCKEGDILLRKVEVRLEHVKDATSPSIKLKYDTLFTRVRKRQWLATSARARLKYAWEWTQYLSRTLLQEKTWLPSMRKRRELSNNFVDRFLVYSAMYICVIVHECALSYLHFNFFFNSQKYNKLEILCFITFSFFAMQNYECVSHIQCWKSPAHFYFLSNARMS